MSDFFDENKFEEHQDFFEDGEELDISPSLFFAMVPIQKLWIAMYDNWVEQQSNIESVLFLINPENYGEYLVLDEYIRQKSPDIETDIIMRDVVKIGFFDVLGYNFNKKSNKSQNIKNND